MVFSGFTPPGLRGEICQSVSDLGKPSMNAFAAGPVKGFGTKSWNAFRLDGMLMEKLIGNYSASMGVWFGHTRRQPVGEKNGPPEEPEDHALGRSRGGFSTKLHVVCDAEGWLIAADVSPGQDHESTHFEELMEDIEIRSVRGPAKRRPEKLAGDKAYSSKDIRGWLKRHRIQPVIAYRDNETERDEPFDSDSYRRRNIVERTIGWLKEFRRIATRYEKLAVHYLGMLKLGMILQYLTY